MRFLSLSLYLPPVPRHHIYIYIFNLTQCYSRAAALAAPGINARGLARHEEEEEEERRETRTGDEEMEEDEDKEKEEEGGRRRMEGAPPVSKTGRAGRRTVV